MVDINDYKVEVSCEYKGETYSVRDNGAIMRHPKNGRIRPLDNQWTFGKKNESNGYMFFASNVRVHQVVATAFWGHLKKDGMVVDHKDTNRCNNRAENLHWVTKLENVLNNPITRQRVINLCGSIEAFLNNPALLGESSADPNFKWMRTVSEEESAQCKSNLERWAKEDQTRAHEYKGVGIGEWIFSNRSSSVNGNNMDFVAETHRQFAENTRPSSPFYKETTNDYVSYSDVQNYYDSLTPNAVQIDWRTPTTFHLCPQETLSLEAYNGNLEKGKLFCSNQFIKQEVVDYAITEKGLLVATHALSETIKPWALALVYIENDKYVHASLGTFFEEIGVMEEFTLCQGKEWTGEHGIDFYCS